ncbi:MAG TPA: M23 family metallopeptidase [Candidatus Aminicenantes bacterium]|nr:MAG: hypothetical protein C0168_08325 [Candidatus Aminicenantes bacterium]HEK85952.1 M23 family metallopeptidase [Candidatus Aminicenantes bacterium]
MRQAESEKEIETIKTSFGRLTAVFIIIFLALFLNASQMILASATVEKEEIRSANGDIFELRFRDLQPGEPLILVWSVKKSPEAEISFLTHFYQLKNEPEKPQFLILGLDLGLRPGLQPLEIILRENGQEKEKINFPLEVKRRIFPIKKLTVDQKYVTPPPEVQERIKREAEILSFIYNQITPKWLADGSFILPCQGKLFPNFGQQRIYNQVPRSVHSGVDIAVAAGTPIEAANSGRVVLASNLYFSGKTVIIDHGLGLYSTYCHLSKIVVKRGNLVSKGQVIGLAGSTGLSTGPHLHWAIKINEARVDPLAFLELFF